MVPEDDQSRPAETMPPAALAPAAPSTPPGWYPDPSYPGHQRYWDGTQWVGQPAPVAPYAVAVSNPSDDRTMAVIAHVGQIFGGFIVPLIVYLVKKDQSAFVKHHAEEALNFAITTAIASIVCVILIFVLIGLLLLPILIIGHLVLVIMAALAAVKYNPTIKEDYQRLLAAGKLKKVALIACARKLLTIINAMLREDKMWSPPVAKKPL